MFVSYKWLEDYVDLKGMDPAVLAEKLQEPVLRLKELNTKEKAPRALSSAMCWSASSTRMLIS